MGRAGKLLLMCSSDAMSDASALCDKLVRRGFQPIITTVSPAATHITSSDAVAILLDSGLISDPALGRAIDTAVTAVKPVFVLRLGPAGGAMLADRALSNTIRVTALGDDRGRDLSRFANVISDHLAAPQQSAIAPDAVTIDPQADRPHAQAKRQGWSWEAFVFGPLWAVYRGLPLPGSFCIMFLAAAVLIASRAQAGLWAPLGGFVAAWLILSLALGATANAMVAATQGVADQQRLRWFRPAGMGGLIAVSALTAALTIASGSLLELAPTGPAQLSAPRPLATRSGPTNPLLVGQAGADYGIARRPGDDGALVLAPGALTDQSGPVQDATGAGRPQTGELLSSPPRTPPPTGRPANGDDAAVVDDIFDADPAQNQCCS